MFLTVMKRLIKNRYLYLMIAPVIIWYIIFCYAPMFGLVIAFKEYDVFDGIIASEWVGLEHFQRFFTSIYSVRLIRNTFLISFYGLVFGFPAPIILALLFNELKAGKFKKLTQTISYLPHFISTVIIVGMFTTFLQPETGLINNIIARFGGERVYFLAEPRYFRSLYIIMDIWRSVGWGSIIYLAALSNVEMELYEACIIDGGGYWRQLWHITLPGIAPTVVIMLILRIGQLMTVGYESIILMYSPATYITGDVISTYVYRVGLQDANYSFSSAVGMFNSVISLILLVFANTVSKRFGETSLW
ncbi:MAG: sugar ABC transporter permease [Clostridia bacterium]|nr:sugar ABC transporter permease [Clostridia bacterium]